MKNKISLFAMSLLTAILCGANSLHSTVSAVSAAPVQTPQTVYEDWSDSARDRAMPVKIYLPKQVDHPLPVVIFSHGLGGSREAAPYLGNYWADHGYIGVFIQHPGSDESFWKPSIAAGGMMNRATLIPKFRQQVKDPTHAVNRAQDVHFVIDKLAELDKGHGVLAGKMDLNSIAIAGHSYGSWTALTASGQTFVTPTGKKVASGDPRIKAAIYLSPTAAKKGSDLDAAYGDIKIPGMHFTGTKDVSPVSDTTAEDRRIAYDHISKSDQYLVILDGADHMVFGAGRQRLAPGHDDANQQAIVADVSTKFLDAYLKHDKAAFQWLRGTGAKTELTGKGTFEFKIASASR
ncbi:MAG: dienelactone hydrolase [Cyanobacteria bacterium SZAS-4]|nr:dienelactone hydrolase [Cyanobacteria bacterium SZAS-4]